MATLQAVIIFTVSIFRTNAFYRLCSNCTAQSIWCPDNEDCVIDCFVTQSDTGNSGGCSTSTIFCPRTPNKCTVNCSTTTGVRACTSLIIDAASNCTGLTVYASGHNEILGTGHILCPHNSPCNIHCSYTSACRGLFVNASSPYTNVLLISNGSEAFTGGTIIGGPYGIINMQCIGYNACKSTIRSDKNGQQLNINGTGQYVLSSSTIYCPANYEQSTCKIDVHAAGALQFSDIYASFYDLNLFCDPTYNEGCADITLFCDSGNSSCRLVLQSDFYSNQWQCGDTTNRCQNFSYLSTSTASMAQPDGYTFTTEEIDTPFVMRSEYDGTCYLAIGNSLTAGATGHSLNSGELNVFFDCEEGGHRWSYQYGPTQTPLCPDCQGWFLYSYSYGTYAQVQCDWDRNDGFQINTDEFNIKLDTASYVTVASDQLRIDSKLSTLWTYNERDYSPGRWCKLTHNVGTKDVYEKRTFPAGTVQVRGYEAKFSCDVFESPQQFQILFTYPSNEPTNDPTIIPTNDPTIIPTKDPSTIPTKRPNGEYLSITTKKPTMRPTGSAHVQTAPKTSLQMVTEPTPSSPPKNDNVFVIIASIIMIVLCFAGCAFVGLIVRRFRNKIKTDIHHMSSSAISDANLSDEAPPGNNYGDIEGVGSVKVAVAISPLAPNPIPKSMTKSTPKPTPKPTAKATSKTPAVLQTDGAITLNSVQNSSTKKEVIYEEGQSGSSTRGRHNTRGRPGTIGGRSAEIIYRDDNEEHCKVKQWLENKCKFGEYLDVFISNGYESVDIIKEMEGKSELEEIGINIKGHQTKIWAEIKKLKAHD